MAVRSMTGYGSFQVDIGKTAYIVEIKTINHRYLKINSRFPDLFNPIQFDIENLVKTELFRGTIYLSIKEFAKNEEPKYAISLIEIQDYLKQIQKISQEIFPHEKNISLNTLLSLPGVITSIEKDSITLYPDLERGIFEAFQKALQKVVSMRKKEGKEMEKELKSYLSKIQKILREIEKRLPVFLEEYKVKLKERISLLLEDHTLGVEPKDLVRELAIFADKTDISEEVLRLKSHIEQFKETLKEKGSIGRKLEFIAQEMLREANTMGAKISDVEALNQIVEIKTYVDKIKEQVQNIE